MGAPYQSQSISGYNASPPPDDGTQVAANKITWNSTIKTKLTDPLNTFAAAINSQLNTWSDFSSVTTSTPLTTTTAHHMQTIEVTSGSPTISLGDAATMTKNYIVTITNIGTGAPVVALATAANTLDGTVNGTFTFPTGTATSVTFKVINAATGYMTEKVGGKNVLAYGSVVTPLVSPSSTTLQLGGAGSTIKIQPTDANQAVLQLFHGSQGVGLVLTRITTGTTITDASNNLSLVGASSIDSGGTGSLSLKTNNGTTGLQIIDVASGARNVTIASSAAGNPTISTTAGSLAITPAVVIAGASLQIGTTPSSTGVIGIPYNNTIRSRNQASSGDINLISCGTVNARTDITLIGDNATGHGTMLQAMQVAGAPSTSDIPSGSWALWRDTSGATTKLYYNNGGTMQSVALA